MLDMDILSSGARIVLIALDCCCWIGDQWPFKLPTHSIPVNRISDSLIVLPRIHVECGRTPFVPRNYRIIPP